MKFEIEWDTDVRVLPSYVADASLLTFKLFITERHQTRRYKASIQQQSIHHPRLGDQMAWYL